MLELLITVSLIGILTAGIVPSFNTYIKNQNLKQAQEQVKSDLRSIQNRALTGSLSSSKVSGSTVQYWGVVFTNSSPSYTFFASYDNSTSVCTSAPAATDKIIGQTLTIPNDIVYSGAAGQVYRCLFFSIKNGNITKIPSASSDYITLKYADGTNSKLIHFNPFGLIYTYEE